MSEKIATFVGNVNEGGIAYQKHYRLDPPFKYEEWDYDSDEFIVEFHENIVMSAIDNMMGHETKAFPADSSGEIKEFSNIFEMPLTTDHEKVLGMMGYEVR